jgi:hypothetical protein
VPFPEELGTKFTLVKLGRLRRKLQQHLATNPDRALADGLATYAQILDQVREPASPLATVPLLAVIGGQIGLWIVLLVFRRRVAPPDEPLYPPAVQGSLFGTPAAGWIYDRMYQPVSSAAAAAPTPRVEDDEP